MGDEPTGGYRQTGTQADGLYTNQHQAELARDNALYGSGGTSHGMDQNFLDWNLDQVTGASQRRKDEASWKNAMAAQAELMERGKQTFENNRKIFEYFFAERSKYVLEDFQKDALNKSKLEEAVKFYSTIIDYRLSNDDWFRALDAMRSYGIVNREELTRTDTSLSDKYLGNRIGKDNFYYIRGMLYKMLGNNEKAKDDLLNFYKTGKMRKERLCDFAEASDYLKTQGINVPRNIATMRKPWNVIIRVVTFFFVASILLRLFVYNNGTFPIYGIIISIVAAAFLGFIFPILMGGSDSTLGVQAKVRGEKVRMSIKVLMLIMLIIGYNFANGVYEKVSTGNLLRSMQSTQETATYNIGDIVTVLDNVNVFRNSNFDDVVLNVYMNAELKIVGNKVIRERNGNNFNYWQVESTNGIRGLVSARYIKLKGEAIPLSAYRDTFDPLGTLSDLFKSLLPKTNFNIGDTVMVKSNSATLWDIRDGRYFLLKVLHKGDELTINGDKNKGRWSVEYEGTQGWIDAGDIKLKK